MPTTTAHPRTRLTLASLVVLLLASPAAGAERWRTVVRVIDGDTILLDGNERVRLIGVDTPETVDPRKPVQAYGKEASAFTRSAVEGRRVRLEQGWEMRDRYGRTLAYVFRDDGLFLNLELVRQGYGHAMTRFPHPRLELFRSLERDARASGRGLWALTPGDSPRSSGGAPRRSRPPRALRFGQTRAVE